MELTVKELKDVIKDVLKSIKEDGEKGRDGYVDPDVKPNGYGKSDSMDFSQKSAEGSRYARQGSSNLGPFTSESMLRTIVKDIITEKLKMRPVPNAKQKTSAPYNTRASVGDSGTVCNIGLPEWKSTKKKGSVWEQLAHWYDVPSTTSSPKNESPSAKYADKMEASLGFKKLKKKLAGKKGVKDPAALAAYIGRKKYGKSGMAKKSAAGRKK